MLILIFFVSLIPAGWLYLWLRNRKKEDDLYRKICKKGLLRGAFLCTALVFLLSSFFYIFEKIFVFLGAGAILIEIYHNFILLAFAEELVKYKALKGLMKKYQYAYSWLDVVSLMMIVGIGFQICESLVYAFGGNAGTMLMRGFTVMHSGYGFIMGYFIAKGMQTGLKKYTLLGILIPFLMHGLYDFCLSDVLDNISWYFGCVSLALAGVAVITLIIAIITIRRSAKISERIEPINGADEVY